MTGADTFSAELAALRQRLDDPRQAFQAAIAEFHQIQSERFGSGADWEPLHDRTLARKTGSQMLVETGGLLDSLTTPNSQWSIVDEQGSEVRLGTSAPHAHLHHEGSGNWLPARPLIDTSPHADERIVRAFTGALMGEGRFGL